MTQNRDERRETGTVTAVYRAGTLLRLFLSGRRGLGVTEAAERLGVAPSTAHRLLRSLCEAGLLHQNVATRRYELSMLVHQLGVAAAMHVELYRHARPALGRLHRVTGEGCHLAVAELPRVRYVDQRDTAVTGAFIQRMGWRAPANCTSTGKLLLAHAPREAREEVLHSGLARLTERSLVDTDRLRDQLDAITDRGWAWSLDEMQIGITSVAAPVVGADGHVVAAVGLASPTDRMRRLSLPRAIENVLSCAADISDAVGGPV